MIMQVNMISPTMPRPPLHPPVSKPRPPFLSLAIVFIVVFRTEAIALTQELLILTTSSPPPERCDVHDNGWSMTPMADGPDRWTNFCGTWFDVGAREWRHHDPKILWPYPLCEVVFEDLAASGVESEESETVQSWLNTVRGDFGPGPFRSFPGGGLFCANAPSTSKPKRGKCYFRIGQEAKQGVDSYQAAQNACAAAFAAREKGTDIASPHGDGSNGMGSVLEIAAKPVFGGYLATMLTKNENNAAWRACGNYSCWIGLRETPAAQDNTDVEEWAWESRPVQAGTSAAGSSTRITPSVWNLLQQNFLNWCQHPDDPSEPNDWGGEEEDAAVMNLIDDPGACFWAPEGDHNGGLRTIWIVFILPCFAVVVYCSLVACGVGPKMCRPRVGGKGSTTSMGGQGGPSQHHYYARDGQGSSSPPLLRLPLSNFYGILLDVSDVTVNVDQDVDRWIQHGARAAIMYAFFLMLLGGVTFARINADVFDSKGGDGGFFLVDVCATAMMVVCKVQVGVCAHKVHRYLSELARVVCGQWVLVLAVAKFLMAGVAGILCCIYISFLVFGAGENETAFCMVGYIFCWIMLLSLLGQTVAAFALFRIHECVLEYMGRGRLEARGGRRIAAEEDPGGGNNVGGIGAGAAGVAGRVDAAQSFSGEQAHRGNMPQEKTPKPSAHLMNHSSVNSSVNVPLPHGGPHPREQFHRVTGVWWKILIAGTFIVGWALGLSGMIFVLGWGGEEVAFSALSLLFLVAAFFQVLAGVGMYTLNKRVKEFFMSAEGRGVLREIERGINEGGVGGGGGGGIGVGVRGES